MLKWIKNSKSSKTNTTSKYRGIRMVSNGKYEASVLVITHNKQNKKISYNYIVGYFETDEEASKKRVEFILNLL